MRSFASLFQGVHGRTAANHRTIPNDVLGGRATGTPAVVPPGRTRVRSQGVRRVDNRRGVPFANRIRRVFVRHETGADLAGRKGGRPFGVRGHRIHRKRATVAGVPDTWSDTVRRFLVYADRREPQTGPARPIVVVRRLLEHVVVGTVMVRVRVVPQVITDPGPFVGTKLRSFGR